MPSTGDGEGDGENVELIAAGEGGSGGDGSGEGTRGAQRMTTPYMTKVRVCYSQSLIQATFQWLL